MIVPRGAGSEQSGWAFLFFTVLSRRGEERLCSRRARMEQGLARATSVACLASARPPELPSRHAAPDAGDGVDIPGATTGLRSAPAGPQTRKQVDKKLRGGR